jgi:hypothetical protein
MFMKVKKKINDYFIRLAKANESTFGAGKELDCCKMNKSGSEKTGYSRPTYSLKK